MIEGLNATVSSSLTSQLAEMNKSVQKMSNSHNNTNFNNQPTKTQNPQPPPAITTNPIFLHPGSTWFLKKVDSAQELFIHNWAQALSMGKWGPTNQTGITWVTPIEQKRLWIKAAINRAFGPGGCNYMPIISCQAIDARIKQSYSGYNWSIYSGQGPLWKEHPMEQ
jgi:hypothetical protein